MHHHPPFVASVRRMPSLGLLILGACALAPLQPDVNAKAPRLDGFGRSEIAVTTRSGEARRLFNDGVLQAYAFNEHEAVRQFKAALALDPSCAMCAWGVAWQLGPNINAPQRGDLTEARQYIVLAQRHADGATARERALIDAMAIRYGERPSADDVKRDGPAAAEVCRSGGSAGDARVNALDRAYADRLRALMTAWPDDADILSLWSEAAMVATSDDWWHAESGQPLPVIAEMVDRLERASARAPQHTGLNHYLIHAADAGPSARRAEAAADRLAALAPKSPHLVHMPSHIYARVGRYADAERVNALALAAEDALDQQQKDQGFKPSKDWRGHNTHFLWYATLAQGRGDEALAAARRLAARSATRDSAFAEFFRSLPLLTLVRLERWTAVLAEPIASGERGIAAAYGQQAHGTALARLGRVAEARVALTQAEAAVVALRAAYPNDSDEHKDVRRLAESAQARLRAEIALAERRGDEALAQQAQVVAGTKGDDAGEPPFSGAGALLALADMQFALGRAVDAEASYRADLQARPDNGWALRGLEKALDAQGKSAEAAQIRERLARAWAGADATLLGRS